MCSVISKMFAEQLGLLRPPPSCGDRTVTMHFNMSDAPKLSVADTRRIAQALTRHMGGKDAV